MWLLNPPPNTQLAGRVLANNSLSFSFIPATYANRCLLAFSEVENSLAAERWLAQQELSAKQLLTEAQGAERLARDRYTKGGGGILELLLSERSVFAAQELLK